LACGKVLLGCTCDIYLEDSQATLVYIFQVVQDGSLDAFNILSRSSYYWYVGRLKEMPRQIVADSSIGRTDQRPCHPFLLCFLTELLNQPMDDYSSRGFEARHQNVVSDSVNRDLDSHPCKCPVAAGALTLASTEWGFCKCQQHLFAYLGNLQRIERFYNLFVNSMKFNV